MPQERYWSSGQRAAHGAYSNKASAEIRVFIPSPLPSSMTQQPKQMKLDTHICRGTSFKEAPPSIHQLRYAEKALGSRDRGPRGAMRAVRRAEPDRGAGFAQTGPACGLRTCGRSVPGCGSASQRRPAPQGPARPRKTPLSPAQPRRNDTLNGAGRAGPSH